MSLSKSKIFFFDLGLRLTVLSLRSVENIPSPLPFNGNKISLQQCWTAREIFLYYCVTTFRGSVLAVCGDRGEGDLGDLAVRRRLHGQGGGARGRGRGRAGLHGGARRRARAPRRTGDGPRRSPSARRRVAASGEAARRAPGTEGRMARPGGAATLRRPVVAAPRRMRVAGRPRARGPASVAAAGTVAGEGQRPSAVV